MTVRELIEMLSAIPEEDKDLSVFYADSEYGEEYVNDLRVETFRIATKEIRGLILAN